MYAIYKSKGKDDLELVLKDVMEKNVRAKLIPFEEFSAIVTNPTQSVDAILYHVIKERMIQETGLPREELSYLTGYRGILKDPEFKDRIHLAPVNFMFDQFTKLNADKNNVVDGNSLRKERILGEKLMIRHIERACTLEYLKALRLHFRDDNETISQLLEDDWHTTRGAWNVSGEAKSDEIIISDFLNLDSYTKSTRRKSILSTPGFSGDEYERASEGLKFVYTLNTITHRDSGWLRKLGELLNPFIRTRRESRELLMDLDKGASYKKEITTLSQQREHEALRRVEEAETHLEEQKRLTEIAEDARDNAENARDHALVAQRNAEQAKTELERIYKRFSHDVGNTLNMLAQQAHSLYNNAKKAEGLDDIVAFRTFHQRHLLALKSQSELSKINHGIAEASLLFLDKKYEKIRTKSQMLDLEELFSNFLPTTAGIYNGLLTNYEEDKNYDSKKLLITEVKFEPGDYKTFLHQSLFYSFAFNLFKNAYDATTDNNNERNIAVYGRDLGDSIELRFKDNGCGMDEETKRILMTPDQKVVSNEGTGLGFFTIRQFIELYKGTYEILTQQGTDSYTELVVTLPKEQVKVQTRKRRRTIG
ncbi:hypothetical protein HN695_04540 [Candidatus Woesearchaeota archaeon]|jgi:signal transduction histidine kinase|nr:hypothetical protein [Candidatus Woesearchaeota archaeon]MBT5271844.1 hypothetical protein [Candidatus Woesearchaeota archaeon]MBT6041692.1 hypothetical protein [Candidatus Woesearchaeota archaeon]MBT6337332.1 hypothetical protein [Candidatus Woesearchaeota archaeon]MBT7927580.1 hypothetical protein [Candidatus Woesearchaeota archaeon]